MFELNLIKRHFLTKLLIFFIIFGLFLLFGPSRNNPFISVTPVQAGFFEDDLEIFEDVLMLVSKNYVYAPDYQRLFYSAIKEMVESINSEKVTLNEKKPGSYLLQYDVKNISFSLGPNMDRNYRIFRKIYDFLLKNESAPSSNLNLEVAGIQGVMKALDSYSQFLDEDAFERSMRDTKGQYGGLGMIITMADYQLTVVKTMKNSPAHRAGILSKDIIKEVNGKIIKGMQIDELAYLLRGYPNTKVSLQVFRPSTKKFKSYTLNREIISVETVEYKKMRDQTGYIKITSFSKQTNAQLEKVLKEAESDKIKSFILDLRDNPGGLLDQSVKVASHFLNRGRLVVFTQGRDKNDRHEYRALFKDALKTIPLAILINEHSASASEIVTGALRDAGRALILGENSFGKGSVQTIFRIRDNSGIRLTTSKYYTPLGIDITEHGIVPEIRIVNDAEFPDEDKTSQSKVSLEKESNGQAYINLKYSAVASFLKEQGLEITQENDPVLLFAHLILKNPEKTGKMRILEKARKLASNIHY